MTDLRTTGKEMQGQVLDTIQKSQDAVTDAIRAWAETVQSVTPSLPTAPTPYADKLPKRGPRQGLGRAGPHRLAEVQQIKSPESAGYGWPRLARRGCHVSRA